MERGPGTENARDGETGPRPPWVHLRIAGAFLLCAATAFAVDGWLRFWVLPVHRGREEKRVVAFNKAVRIWGRVLFAAARWAVGLRVRIEGVVPPSGRFLIVSNHQSSLDIPLLITTLRAQNLKFVSMEALGRGRPAISLALRHGGFVIIHQKSVGDDLAQLARFAANVERFDGSPVIFPAGGLERTNGPRPFRLAGIEAIRRGSGLPILPVAINGMEGAPSIGHVIKIRGARVTLRVLDPIPCDVAGSDPRSAYAQLERRIYGAVAEMRGETESNAPRLA